MIPAKICWLALSLQSIIPTKIIPTKIIPAKLLRAPRLAPGARGVPCGGVAHAAELLDNLFLSQQVGVDLTIHEPLWN